MNHVLLAVDSSPHSRFATNVLSRFPFADPPKVTIVSVCPVPDLHGLGHEVTSSVNALVDECRSDSKTLMDEVREQLGSRFPVVETKLLDGHPGKEIIAAIDSLGTDLVVVGARGVGAAHRWLLGSVSEKVVKYAPCSVLVTHDDTPDRDPEIRRLLIADDGSPAADHAVNIFSQLPLGPDRHVQLYAAMETMKSFGVNYQIESSPEFQKATENVQQHLTSAKARFETSGAQVDIRFEHSTNVPESIINAAEESKSDLIVMGSTGRTQWEKLLLGSVAQRVLHHAPCSIWVDRPRR